MFCTDLTPDGAGGQHGMGSSVEVEASQTWMPLMKFQDDFVSEIGEDSASRERSEEESSHEDHGQIRSKKCNTIIAPTNTRIIGTLITVHLRKGPSGSLGFSITTRDNLSGFDSPIYIKHIILDGAANKDGRLRPGDRLIQVNDTSIVGKRLKEVTAILRGIKTNSVVRITVSRQLFVPNDKTASLDKLRNQVGSSLVSKHLPDDLFSVENAGGSQLDTSVSKSDIANVGNCSGVPLEVLTLPVHVIHSGMDACQLGLKVKRSRRKSLTGLDIRSVIPGGVADVDGQLQTSDHLIEVNGVSVVNLDKSKVIDIFRAALLDSRKTFNIVNVKVIRQRAEKPSTSIISKDANTLASESTCQVLQNVDDRCFDFLSCLPDASMLTTNVESSTRNVVTMSYGNTLPCEISFCDFTEASFRQLSDSFDESFHSTGNSIICNVLSNFSEDQQYGSAVFRIADDWNGDGKSPQLVSCTAKMISLQDQDFVTNSNVVFFLRQGFGRRSISERHGCRDLLSGSEIYCSIKRNRRKKETGNVAGDYAYWKSKRQGVRYTSVTPEASCEPAMEFVKVEPAFQASADVAVIGESTTCDSASSMVRTSSPGQNQSETLPSTPVKSTKKFDMSSIRGFLKKGFAELFRSGTQGEIHCHGLNGDTGDKQEEVENKKRSNASDNWKRLSLPWYKSRSQHSGEDTVFSCGRLLSLQPRTPCRPNLFLTATPAFYHEGPLPYRHSQSNTLPSTRSTFPVHFSQYPYTGGFQQQYRHSRPHFQPSAFPVRSTHLSHELSARHWHPIQTSRAPMNFIQPVPPRCYPLTRYSHIVAMNVPQMPCPLQTDLKQHPNNDQNSSSV